MLFARSYAFPVSRSSFPLFSFPICVPVRLARRLVCRLVGRLVMSSRFVRFCCVVPSVGSSCPLRLVVSACRLVWAPFRSAIRSFSSRLPWRDCPFVVVPPCWSRRPPFVHRPVLVSRRLGSSRSSRSHSSSCPVSSVGGSCPFSCLVPVFAPFRPAHRSFLFAIRPGSCLRRGGGAVSSWPWDGGGLLMSFHPSPHRSRLLLVRPLLDGYVEGWIWDAVPCCSPLIHCLFMSHHFSHLIGFPIASICVLIPSSEAKKNERDGNRDGDARE